ncbi:MAG: peptidoglycan DD-metalloendopeptidase family protein [Flavobacteriaceae bacterium]|jgi:murein DD-endopeptidase|nr:peptidoglycan DD-metalloendopeptidase family protein [Flavobacteriaceae bacterium]MDP4674476.1 peptidoglycan DD-metalloendopeptidase family protein [Flavobacteriaceae bacterium]MDP4754247.1 peptidoglycan DD-metalloendopeptidase family protein [Flavobacteriaceae bacterium]MDP4794225.1 peptidoglycan DD-metalloendopeptidase family protein [Flavobacteriaceae bacterium]MDP4885815.1 peptidoglycan DD-metalloendopeptidase family protein [Flavobacteriaceae bacterium]
MRLNQTYLLPFVLFLLISCGKKGEEAPEVPEKPKDSIFYGFNFNHFEVIKDTVRDGDSFGSIMAQHQVAYPEVHAATQKEYREIFDVRRLRQGQPYVILKSKDSIQKPQVFIYERDKINFSVIDFRQDLKVYSEQREIITHMREASGVITSSLSETILDQGMDYDVTHNLASIYAWTIDFFQLQEGDRFKVIYEERFIKDSTYAGMGPIKAAIFEHGGKTYYAFRHKTDEDQNYADYFDEKGNNLRRAFLQAPVNFSRISSRYNLKRKIAFYGNKVRPHLGTDYAAAVGTPILATANGKVIESSFTSANGNYVKIRHNSTYTTQYLHMKKQNVRKGQSVKQGDVIGWIGMTGNTSGPHVCYRFWKNGRQVDPLREKLPMSNPLPSGKKETYLAQIDSIKGALDKIQYTE